MDMDHHGPTDGAPVRSNKLTKNGKLPRVQNTPITEKGKTARGSKNKEHDNKRKPHDFYGHRNRPSLESNSKTYQKTDARRFFCSNASLDRTIRDVEGPDLRFYFVSADYSYDERFGTVINIYGNVHPKDFTEDYPVMVRATGFEPHFWIKWPSEWSDSVLNEFIMIHLDSALKVYLDVLAGGGSGAFQWKDVKECAENHGTILSWSLTEGEELMEHTGEGVCRFADVRTSHPKMIQLLRDILENPKKERDPESTEFSDRSRDATAPEKKENYKIKETGDEKYNDRKRKVPRWCPKGMVKVVKNLKLFECDVDFIIRFLVDTRFSPCNWFKIHAKDYEIVPKRDKSRYSTCDVEVTVPYQKIEKESDPEYSDVSPRWTVLVTDFECENTDGQEFPNADRHKILQIAFALTDDSHPDEKDYTRFLFALDRVENVKTADTIYWYEDEKELIKDVVKFVKAVDPDVFTHHNGNGFDIKYLLDRSKKLGILYSNRFGRTFKRSVSVSEKKHKGKKMFSVIVPGRINMDTMRIAQNDFRNKEFGLNALSKHYLGGDTKVEFSYEMIDKKQQTMKGREEMGYYCIVDAVLCMRLLFKWLSIPTIVETAKLSCIPVQLALDRQQGIKIEGKLRQECNKPGVPPKLKIVEKYEKRKESKEEGKYKGATVLPPKKGDYGDVPVVTLDFSSMYPTIIMLRNLCYTTKVSNDVIRQLGLREGIDYWRLPDYEDSVDEATGRRFVKEVENLENPVWLTKSYKAGILPEIERELKIERSKVRGEAERIEQEIEELRTNILKDFVLPGLDQEKREVLDRAGESERNTLEKRYLQEFLDENPGQHSNLLKELYSKFNTKDARQLAIKMWMNAIYGITGSDAGAFGMKELAKTITAEGRAMILKIDIETEEYFNKKNGFYFDAEVIYGDTDSIFVALWGVSPSAVEEACSLGELMAKHVTKKLFQAPVKLEFEKTYENLQLLSGKMYYAKKWMVMKSGPEFDIKGCPMIKSVGCEYVKSNAKKVAEKLVMEGDLDGSLKMAREKVDEISMGYVSVVRLTEKQQLSKELSEYGRDVEFQDSNGNWKVRKGSETVAASVAKRKWGKITKKAKSEGVEPGRAPGPGTIIKYVMIDADATYNEKRPKNNKRRKGECAEEPMTVISEKIPIDYDAYKEKLLSEYVRVLRPSVMKRHPTNSSTNSRPNQSILCFATGRNGEPPPPTDIQMREKTKEQTEKENREYEKASAAHVKREIYQSTGRREIKIKTKVRKGEGINRYFSVAKECVACQATLPASFGNGRDRRKTNLCPTCSGDEEGSTSKLGDLMTREKEFRDRSETIWATCMKCMNTDDIEEPKACINASCQYRGEREDVDEKVKNLSERVRDLNSILIDW